MKRLPLITSFVLFIALCVTVSYWAMQFFKPPIRAVVIPSQTPQPLANLEAAEGLFGGHAVAADSTFQLKGVVAAGDPAQSVALLATNGKPPKAVRINAEVLPGITVKDVQKRYVLLSDNGVIKRVDLPVSAKHK